MRLTMPRLLLCFSLLASGQLVAAESRHMGPNGEGACPDSSANANERVDEAEETAGTPARRNNSQKSKPTATPRTGGGPRSTPRWHSFLPGMIR